jgi:hypothetical protein
MKENLKLVIVFVFAVIGLVAILVAKYSNHENVTQQEIVVQSAPLLKQLEDSTPMLETLKEQSATSLADKVEVSTDTDNLIIGKSYVFKAKPNKNPFDPPEHDIMVTIVDMKSGYVQYCRASQYNNPDKDLYSRSVEEFKELITDGF